MILKLFSYGAYFANSYSNNRVAGLRVPPPHLMTSQWRYRPSNLPAMQPFYVTQRQTTSITTATQWARRNGKTSWAVSQCYFSLSGHSFFQCRRSLHHIIPLNYWHVKWFMTMTAATAQTMSRNGSPFWVDASRHKVYGLSVCLSVDIGISNKFQ